MGQFKDDLHYPFVHIITHGSQKWYLSKHALDISQKKSRQITPLLTTKTYLLNKTLFSFLNCDVIVVIAF